VFDAHVQVEIVLLLCPFIVDKCKFTISNAVKFVVKKKTARKICKC